MSVQPQLPHFGATSPMIGHPDYRLASQVKAYVRVALDVRALRAKLGGALLAAVAGPLFAAGGTTIQAAGVQVVKFGAVEWHGAFPGGTAVGVFQISPKTPDCPRGLGMIDLSNSAGLAMMDSLKTARTQNKTINATFASQGPKGYCVATAITVLG